MLNYLVEYWCDDTLCSSDFQPKPKVIELFEAENNRTSPFDHSDFYIRVFTDYGHRINEIKPVFNADGVCVGYNDVV